MTRRTQYSTRGLIARHIASRLGGTVAVALLVALSVWGLAVLPRAFAAVADDELQYGIGALSPARVDVTGSATLGTQSTDATTVEGIFGSTDAALRAVPPSIPSPLGDLMGDAQWIAQLRSTAVDPPAPRAGISPEVRLTVDLDGADNVRYLEGAAPAEWNGRADDPSVTTVPLEIAVSRAGADAFGLSVGDELGSPYGPLRVSGIVEPAQPTSVFWAHNETLLAPLVIKAPGSLDTVIVSAFINPLSVRGVPVQLAEAELTVWYPTVQPELQYSQSDDLLQQIARLSAVGSTLPNGQRLSFHTGLSDAVDGVTARVSTLVALLGLVGSAPLGAVIAALVLGIRTVVAARQPALDLSIARGATAGDARRIMAIEGAAVALAATGIGLAAAAATTGTLGGAALAAPLLLAAAVPVIFAFSLRIRRGRPHRLDARSRGRSRGRWLIEASVIGLAAVAYLLLSRRGLASAAVGFDPLLALTPLLLSLAVCVVVLRVYPVPLLAIQRAARGRRGVVALLGSARAVRQPAIGFVSVVAMLVGVSTAVFSLVLAATLSAGLEVGARTSVGADARIDSAAITDAELRELRAVDGVDAAAALEYVARVDVRAESRLTVTLVIADTAALHAVRPDLPSLTETDPPRVLVSSDLADRVGSAMTIDGQQVAPDGFLDADALPGVTDSWMLIDAAFADTLLGRPFAPTTVLLAGPTPSATGLREALPGGTLIETSAVLAESAARPSVSGLRAALTVASALAALMAALTVALGAVASAPARNRLVSVAHILGMSPRQSRGVVAWDIAPIAVVSITAGVGLGVILPLLVLGVVDLRALIGGSSAVPITIPWALVAAGAAGFCAVTALAGFISIAVARRVDPARQLRIGAE
jgi:putative ABC transport system permease protein